MVARILWTGTPAEKAIINTKDWNKTMLDAKNAVTLRPIKDRDILELILYIQGT